MCLIYSLNLKVLSFINMYDGLNYTIMFYFSLMKISTWKRKVESKCLLVCLEKVKTTVPNHVASEAINSDFTKSRWNVGKRAVVVEKSWNKHTLSWVRQVSKIILLQWKETYTHWFASVYECEAFTSHTKYSNLPDVIYQWRKLITLLSTPLLITW